MAKIGEKKFFYLNEHVLNCSAMIFSAKKEGSHVFHGGFVCTSLNNSET